MKKQIQGVAMPPPIAGVVGTGPVLLNHGRGLV